MDPAPDSAELATGGANALGDDRLGQRTRAEFGLALAVDLAGALGATLIALQTWQVVTVHASRPRPDVVVHLTGRTIDAAPLAFALVALAGVVAVLATRGIARRVVGVVIAAVGVGLIWRAVDSVGAVSTSRARVLIASQHREITVGTSPPTIAVHTVWPVLTVICGRARRRRWRARRRARPPVAKHVGALRIGPGPGCRSRASGRVDVDRARPR